MCVIKFCGVQNVARRRVQAHQLAAAVLGWRTRRQVEQGAVTAAAGGCAGRTRSPVQAAAAHHGRGGARWRRVSDLRSTSAVATAKVHRSFAGTG